MKFAFADPPYPNRANTERRKTLYDGHPDDAGPVDHAALIQRLCNDYADGWALCTGSRHLRSLLLLCPDDVRVLSWVKHPASGLLNQHPTYSWEPVIMRGGRRPAEMRDYARDSLTCGVPPQSSRAWGYVGSKPPAFCRWVFACLGATTDDALDDLFPGSGGVAAEWQRFASQGVLDFGTAS